MRLLRRLLHWPWLGRQDNEVAEELEHHRALVQADLEAQGMPAADAAAASRRAMGNLSLAREESRDVWIFAWVDRSWRDLRHGIRGLRREPTFALATILTLALGVTTTTTMFSVADAELWRPLPFPDPHQLVAVSVNGPGAHASNEEITRTEFLAWRAGVSAFSNLAAVGRSTRAVLRLDTAQSILVREVTSNYFDTLGRSAILGRTFTNNWSGGPRPAVLTDRAWQRLFAADPSALDRAVLLDDAPVVIVGVVRVTESIGQDPDAFVPIDERTLFSLDRTAIGRLRLGVDPNVAREELKAIEARQVTESSAPPGPRTVDVQELGDYFASWNWRPLYFFLGASLFVLLLSAVNAATLLVARAFRRTREFALRGALGAGDGALVRQLLTEGALVAAPAGAVGLLVAAWTVQAFTSAMPAGFLQRGEVIPVDWRVAAFAVAVAGLSTLIFVLVPLPFARRLDLATALSPGGRTGRSRAEGQARAALLIAQIALTVVLLSSAGIFLKSFVALTQEPLGFDPTDGVVVRTSLSGPRYATGAALLGYSNQLLIGARALPGVRSAAIATSSPLGSGPVVHVVRPDQPRPAVGSEPDAIVRAASPDYFRTLGIQLESGREFSAADVSGAPHVAVINETLARELFASENPIGRDLDILPQTVVPATTSWMGQLGRVEIVGVSVNCKDVGLNEIDFGNLYVPFAQAPAPVVELIARAAGPVAGLSDLLRRYPATIDPAVPVTSVSTFDERITRALQGYRFNLILVTVFAVQALLLAAIGIAGAIAYHVEARTREFGVRLALGARPSRLVGMAILQAGRVGAIGAALGLAITLLVAVAIGPALYLVPRVHEGLLYRVSTTDPTTLLSASAAIVLVALVAGAIPARRVAHVDPMLALRTE